MFSNSFNACAIKFQRLSKLDTTLQMLFAHDCLLRWSQCVPLNVVPVQERYICLKYWQICTGLHIFSIS